MNLPELSLRRPTFITSVLVMLLLIGYTSMKKMPVDLFPDVTFPILFIGVPYPGASPEDIEKQVSQPIEEELSSLSGLKNLTSNNLDSVGLIILEFNLGSDIKDLEQQVRNRLGNIRNKLPLDVKEPIIRRFDPADQPVISLAVSSALPEGDLFDLVDQTIKPQIERVNDVGQVRLVGGRKKQIQVLVDKNKLQDHQLSMTQVVRRIKETSQDVPIGLFSQAAHEQVYRAVGEFASMNDLKRVTVNFLGSDRPVTLGEIAEVKMSLEDPTQMVRMNGVPSLYLEVFKQSGSNTVAVVDRIKSSLDKINTLLKTRKVDAKIEMVRDSSVPIQKNIADVQSSILFGIFLTIVVVYFFLGSLRSTLITGLALPNSLLGGFIIMYFMGFSINLMTLLALSLAVGLLIDDAIVVRENIFRKMELGLSPQKAALEGTQEVAQAVVATTMVVIAVFGPIAFLQGMVGQFFKQFGLTVVFTMIISLFDAFTVAPMLSAYMASPKEHEKGNGFWSRLTQSFDRVQSWLEDRYDLTVRYTLSHRRWVISFSIFIFVSSIVLVKFIPKTFLPPNDLGEFAVTIELPTGSSLSNTDEFVKQIEALLHQEKSVDLVSTTIGSKDSESNKANLFVRLVPAKQRHLNTIQTKDLIRHQLASFSSQARIAVSDIDISGGGQKPLNLTVSGENLNELSTYVEKLMKRIEQISDLTDVDTNFRSGKKEFHVVFDRDRSESLGVSTVGAGTELRLRTEGADAAIYRDSGKEYNIRVRLAEAFRNLSEHFNDTLVPNSNFNMIKLNRVAKAEIVEGFSQINRQNKGRFILISANLSTSGSLGSATTQIEQILQKELPLPPGLSYRFQGQAEDFKDLIGNMLLAMGLAVVFIYLVLASLYESFVTPLTILLALPMGISGAMYLLFLTGRSIDIFSLIGIVMLLGVVAKNSILLVDYTQRLIGEGLERNEAILKASRTRLRPILMTSLALIAGTAPIAIGLSELGTQRQSMGIAIVGGVLSSTALTLILVPAAYGYIDDFRLWCRSFL